MAAPTVYSLVGNRDIDSALRCYRSLFEFAQAPFTLVILDDSTLTAKSITKLKHEIPSCEVISKQERDALVDEKLNGYPYCKAFRARNVLAQKLFDCSIINKDPFIQFVDSDVLFVQPFIGFPSPSSDQTVSHFMADTQSAYSFTPLQLFRNSNLRVPRSINTGVIVFPKKLYNLNRLEQFLEMNLDQPSFNRTACWAEQTCWGLLAGDSICKVWDSEQFVIASPRSMLSISERTIAVHFVSSYRGLLQEFKGLDLTKARHIQQLESHHMKTLGVLDFSYQRARAKLDRLASPR